jgi:hypothetical protein
MKHSYIAEEKFLEHKNKRKWKPYNALSYAEKKRLADRETRKDYYKSVICF